MWALVVAFADALVSGTDQAILYESCQAAGAVDRFPRLLASGRVLWPLAGGLSSFGAAWIVARDPSMRLLYRIACVPMIFAVFVSCFLKDPDPGPKHDHNSQRPDSVLAYCLEALHEVRATGLLGYTVVVNAAIQVAFKFQSLVMEEAGTTMKHVGLFASLSFGLSALGAALGPWLSERLGLNWCLRIACALLSTCMILASLVPGSFVGLAMSGSAIGSGMLWVLLANAINSSITNHARRATIISSFELGKRLGVVAAAPILGRISDAYSPCLAYQICALALFVASLCAPIPSEKQKRF